MSFIEDSRIKTPPTKAIKVVKVRLGIDRFTCYYGKDKGDVYTITPAPFTSTCIVMWTNRDGSIDGALEDNHTMFKHINEGVYVVLEILD